MIARNSRGYSLRRHLLWLIMGGSCALWLASAAIIASIAWRETKDVFDDALKESGYLIVAATTDWHERGLPPHAPTRLPRKVEIHYQVVVDGKVVQRTSGAPVQPFVADSMQTAGFDDIRIGKVTWRVFRVPSPDRRFTVEVAQENARRLDILVELAEHLAFPLLAMLAVIAAASWFAIGRMIRPIADTALGITAKSRDDLTPLSTENQPAELLPIVDSLNGVLARLDGALQAERRFTADAAHELRTPLAAVHMHVQLMQRQHPELDTPLARLRADIERCVGLVDSLLTLARLDPISSADLKQRQTLVRPMLEELVRAHADQAMRLGMTLKVRCMTDFVSADAALLRIALRNLLDNAMHYSKPGCTVEISAGWNAGAARVSVSDDGPGVSVEDRRRLAERFFRVLGSGREGNGLGLSIVKRIVELHGATLAFDAGKNQRGLAVSIDFPVSAARPQPPRHEQANPGTIPALP